MPVGTHFYGHQASRQPCEYLLPFKCLGLSITRTSSNPDQRNRLDLHSSATPPKNSVSQDSQPSWKDLLQPHKGLKSLAHPGPTHQLSSLNVGIIIWHLSPPIPTSRALHVPQEELIIGLQMTPESENWVMALGIWNLFNRTAEQALLVFKYATQTPIMRHLNSSPAMMSSRVPAPVFTQDSWWAEQGAQGICKELLMVFLWFSSFIN